MSRASAVAGMVGLVGAVAAGARRSATRRTARGAVLTVAGLGTAPTPDPADLHDLEAVAQREGISRTEAFHRYAWNPEFGPLARRLARDFPDIYSSAVMNPPGFVGWLFRFTEPPPKAALRLIATLPVPSRVVTDQPYTAAQVRVVLRVTRAAVRRVFGPQPHRSVGYDAETRTVEVRPDADVDVVTAAADIREHLRRHLGDLPVPDVRIHARAPDRRG